MLIHKFQPLTDILDWLHHFWERPSTQRRIALFLLLINLVLGGAIAGLAGSVELKRLGLYPLWLPQPPESHFYAIHLAFTLILAMEVMSLIFVIPSSLSQSMGKQFEILTLILLRNAFKELAALPEPISTISGGWWRSACPGPGRCAFFSAWACTGASRGGSALSRVRTCACAMS